MSDVEAGTNHREEVRHFYDQVGWQLVGQDLYQNAHYEDLRPVAHEYIHRCHLRVARYLKPTGKYLLDAGSGPIQYPEYLAYSKNYRYRVCADISIVALREARRRIGERGLFVVCDVANLPFKPDTFDGVVSLHTIHHLPEGEHLQAYAELYRVLAADSSAAVVNGWPSSPLMNFFDPLIRWTNRGRGFINRLLGRPVGVKAKRVPASYQNGEGPEGESFTSTKGTFTNRHDVAWVKNEVGARMPLSIYTWRSVSVRFLRTFIHPRLGGQLWLRLLYWLEERFPHYFGEKGQYPLIVIKKG